MNDINQAKLIEKNTVDKMKVALELDFSLSKFT